MFPMAEEPTKPLVTLYTNHGCPWAHRVHITLRALNLPYSEIIIPLDRPSELWYLEINPRGLVPTIKISNGILKDEIMSAEGEEQERKGEELVTALEKEVGPLLEGDGPFSGGSKDLALAEVRCG